MPPLARICYGVAIAMLSLTATAAPTASDFPLPALKRGIWAMSLDQEIQGQEHRRLPETVATFCMDPAATLRRQLRSTQREGCNTVLGSQKENAIGYTFTCPPGPGRSKNGSVTIESKSPEEFKVTTNSDLGRVVTANRWVRECTSREAEKLDKVANPD